MIEISKEWSGIYNLQTIAIIYYLHLEAKDIGLGRGNIQSRKTKTRKIRNECGNGCRLLGKYYKSNTMETVRAGVHEQKANDMKKTDSILSMRRESLGRHKRWVDEH